MGRASGAWVAPRAPAVAICTAQTLFARGGVELLVDALERELRARGHRVEVVRLPFSWAKAELLAGALAWRLLTVEAERVIATNFPSYFVRHARKTVWLVHQHRPLYDLYASPFSQFGGEPGDAEVRAAMAAADSRFLSEARRVYTISRNVAARARTFTGIAGEPLYHPPPLARALACQAYDDFILMPTRLEPHKRPELLVEAMRFSRSGMRAVIAGRGPLEPELRRRIEAAGLADRVHLAGYLDEAALLKAYACCAGVFYVPFDEDYGYVTLEAFHARKPVVTATDAGGVLEFVTDGETGLVAEPDPEALAQRIDRLAGARDLCRRLGEAGHARVKDISWDAVIQRLVEEA